MSGFEKGLSYSSTAFWDWNIDDQKARIFFDFLQTFTPCLPSGFGCWTSSSKWTMINIQICSKFNAFIFSKKYLFCFSTVKTLIECQWIRTFGKWSTFTLLFFQMQKSTAPTLQKVSQDLRCQGQFDIFKGAAPKNKRHYLWILPMCQ